LWDTSEAYSENQDCSKERISHIYYPAAEF
jgi:hypothetical protein